MDHFEYRGGVLHAEDVSLETIAAEVGTPAYVYSTATLRRHYRVLAEAIGAHPQALREPLIAFAVKANGNVAVLATLARLGAGADTVSEGEIRRALAAGVPPERIVFSGVGKTDAELAFAVTAGVRQINIESRPELERLIAVSRGLGRSVEVAIRVNPKVGAGGHAKITTGGATDKFGVAPEEALELYAAAAASGPVKPVGLACHIGSQITDLAPLRAAFGVLRDMTLTLRERGLEATRLDLGGGLGVPYAGGAPTASPADYAAMAAEVLRGLEVQATFEPGRLLAANAGVLLTRVVHVNVRPDGRRFLVLDAGMNDLMRPALYDAFHDLKPVRLTSAAPIAHDVVGPVCETGDTFARDRPLPPVEAGALMAFTGAGAYGASMANEYNSRLLAPEVLIDGARWAVVRERPTYDSMIARDRVPAWLQ
ncbi:MAG: diaminopimelate decarboxylase [Brevundimonas sp.]